MSGDETIEVEHRDADRVCVGAQSRLEEFYSLTQNVRASSEDVVQDLIDERRAEALGE